MRGAWELNSFDSSHRLSVRERERETVVGGVKLEDDGKEKEESQMQACEVRSCS